MHFLISEVSEPDIEGKHQFVMDWVEPDGVYRKELSRDGKPVGHRWRFGCFRTPLGAYCARLLDQGHTYEIR